MIVWMLVIMIFIVHCILKIKIKMLKKNVDTDAQIDGLISSDRKVILGARISGRK